MDGSESGQLVAPLIGRSASTSNCGMFVKRLKRFILRTFIIMAANLIGAVLNSSSEDGTQYTDRKAIQLIDVLYFFLASIPSTMLAAVVDRCYNTYECIPKNTANLVFESLALILETFATCVVKKTLNHNEIDIQSCMLNTLWGSMVFAIFLAVVLLSWIFNNRDVDPRVNSHSL